MKISLRFAAQASIASLLLLLTVDLTAAVKKEDFKTCEQSGFCRRNRRYADYILADPDNHHSPYWLNLESLRVNQGVLTGLLHEEPRPGAESAPPPLVLTVKTSTTGVARIHITEKEPKKPRFDQLSEHVLVGNPFQTADDGSLTVDNETARYAYTNDSDIELVLYGKPWRVELHQHGKATIVLNERGLMRFERVRDKPTLETETPESEAPPPTRSELEEIDEDGAWEEDFKGSHDSKPNGPTAIGLDITFPGSKHVYGIPEHASSLSLKTTRGGEGAYTDPYRLYNLDVFEHDSDSPMALYGSVPLMLAHRDTGHTAAVFWLNSAETWVDIVKESLPKNQRLGGLDKLTGLSTRTHWISESGVLDLFLLPGSRPADVYEQYAGLTGTVAQPPEFSLAYHQSRWNYRDQDDVRDVDANFDKHDIPYDVIWLDIDHTNERRYFTWDESKFSDPVAMQENVASKGRKMVNIVDPHIKKDSDFYMSREGTEGGYWVKKSDGSDYEAWCWPGHSNWVDYLNPKAFEWWVEKFRFDQYKHSTEHLHIWNDMNEPSVFSGPEITMHKDAVHYGGWEHRDIHNLNGLLYHLASARGVQRRTDPHRRPFVLSRAFFSGTQRISAIWTGDNLASWKHLALSLPMVLSINTAGVPFAGADVGGFFGNPEPELLVRWYQAGAFQPFFRAHAHLEAKRREPWLFKEEDMKLIRAAVRARYSLLPYWYTVFRVSSLTGMPVARPMFVEFPLLKKLFDNEKQYMVGDALLIRPVTEPGVASVDVYLPGDQPWFDYFSYVKYPSGQHQVTTPIDRIPVFIRGGTIVPTRQRIRRASSLMKTDPFTLIVALDDEGDSTGELYHDDGESYDHLSGGYLHRRFTLKDGVLRSTQATGYQPTSLLESTELNDEYRRRDDIQRIRVERIILLGWLGKPIKKAHVTPVEGGETHSVDVTCEKLPAGSRDASTVASTRCVVRDPAVLIAENWQIRFGD